MSDTKREKLRELVALRGSPAKQADYATQLLAPKNGLEVVKAAVDVLSKHPAPAAKPSLCRLYWHYAEHNGTRDPAAYTRSAILKALREITTAEDVDLVVDAVTTYEFLPPLFTEEAALLRSTAIVLLSELDDQVAAFFATRLLADGYTESMSGQPALTAVRVLAAQGELLPLYYYAIQHQHGGHPEVMAECLRNLGQAPDAVVSELVSQYGKSEDRAALVGLFDMLVMGPGAPRHPDYLAAFLQETKDLDLFRYLATVMITSPNAEVQRALADAVDAEYNSDKVEILRETLAIAPLSAEMRTLMSRFA